jgi:D-glycero-D-manno-heptose 1,7-bisphosphate phosphatase
MRKAIILDRDGTFIIDKIYLNDAREIEYLPGCFEGLRRMRDLGFVFAVATNQSGIARGLVDIRNLYAIHERIRGDMAAQGIDFLGFYYAPYSVESNHYLRKPNPGMLETAAREHGLDLSQSWMIGDRDTDVLAGRAAGCRTILLKPEGLKPGESDAGANAVCADLIEAARFIESFRR